MVSKKFEFTYLKRPEGEVKPAIIETMKYLKEKGVKEIIGAEIGVLRGENAESILKHYPQVKLHLIDDYVGLLDRKPMPEPFLIYGDARLRLEPYKDRVHWHIMTSNEARWFFGKYSLDFLYIDGDHSEKGFKSDFLFWYDKVKVPGVICGDGIYVIKNYLDSICIKNNLIFHYDENLYDWWLFKEK